ncbi:MAG TPA: zf-HC2 domain-containing protein [Acidobacteriota bacterium]|nr:zf-HC2 domain-containing protein [Acidobacteriota bacterium]
MNCSAFEIRIERLHKGLLTPAERQEVEGHLKLCSSCRELARLASVDFEAPLLRQPHDLTRSILERTSGPACGRAQEHLCEFVDGNLENDYEEILSLHLEGCSGCSALVDSLRELKDILPQLGEIDPGLTFSFRVLRATSRQLVKPRVSLWPRVQRWWLRLIQRPRFSLEAAYLGTILLVCVFGNPLTAVQELSLRAAALHKSERVVSLPSLALPGSLMSSDTGVLKSTREFAEDLSRRQEGLAKSAVGTFERGFRSLQGFVQAEFRSARSLPSRAAHVLAEAWTALFPKSKSAR